MNVLYIFVRDYMEVLSFKLKEEFVILDKNEDGNISVEELELFLKSIKDNLKMTNREIHRLVISYDENRDGNIDTQEFVSLITTGEKRHIIKKVLTHRHGIRETFEKYDLDESGFISRDEFRKVVEDKYETILGSDQIDLMMLRVDKNNDGKIDYEEFFKAFRYFPVHDSSYVCINR